MVRARALIVALWFVLLSLSPVAHAKGGDKPVPEISETGISAFDTVFMKVDKILDTVRGAEGRLNNARDKIAAAVGQPAGTSIRMSMWELKQKAGGKVQVRMNGAKPALSLGGGSGDAQAGVRATNEAVREISMVVVELGRLPKQVTELIGACKAFPSQIGPAAKEAGLAPTAIPKLAGAVGGNIKATAAAPAAIASLVKTANEMLIGIPQGLAATEPPTEGKGAKKQKVKAEKKKGSASEIPDTELGRLIADAMRAFDDAEVDEARRLLDRAESRAAREATLSPDEIQWLYQARGLVLLVQGERSAALEAIGKALEADRSAKPLPGLGSEYARVHKSLQKSGAF